MSQKQPYNYTLPEQFLADQSVPARWRVWALINGFFITGQKCWASNEWIAEKIGSHKDTASQAIKDLEKIGVIRCVRGARSRDIFPMIGTNAYQWSALTPINDRHQRLSISVSNSVKEKGASKEDAILVVKDEPQKIKPKRNTEAWNLKEKMYDAFEKSTGVRPTPNFGDYNRIAAALKRMKALDIEYMVEDALAEGKKRTLREMLTSREVDIYLQDHS